MKVRSDFVSNSSSSSFILAGDEKSFVSKFKLTKQDFIDAILDLSGGKEAYEKFVAEHKSKWWDGNWFEVYDKTIPADAKILKGKRVHYLKEWTNHILATDYRDGKVYRDDGWNLASYNKAYEALRKTFNLPWTYDVHAKANYTYTYNAKTEKTTKKKVPEYVDKVVRELYKHYGVLTNHDVLMMGFSRFLFHFGDNDIYNLDGTTAACKTDKLYENPESDWEKQHNAEVKSGIYETESHSIERVCEVLFNWFKKNNRLPGLKDESWKDLCNDVVAVTMHEG